MHLSEKLLAALEDQQKGPAGQTMIKRGWQYYKEDQVVNVNEGGHDNLYGLVQGTELYAVILDGEQFRYSSCTCPVTGFCKHMAAVYFKYCNEQGGGHEHAERSYFRLLGISSASSLLNSRSKEQAVELKTDPGEDGDAKDWLDWMEATHGETWRKCRHSLHALQPVLSSLKGLSRDWEKPKQHVHWSMAILFVLAQAERAIETVDSFSRYYHEISFARMAEPWEEHLYTLISELAEQTLASEIKSWVDDLVAFVKVRASKNEHQLFSWSQIYFTYSKKLSVNREWYDRELRSMLELASHETDEEINQEFVQISIGMLYFYDKRDERTLEHFAQTSFEKTQRYMYPCVDQRIEEGQWELVQLWMSFLFERVYQTRNGLRIGPFVTLCRKADEECQQFPIWNTYMVKLLPHSYQVLSDHWLKQKRYFEWADLQLLVGSRLQDLDQGALREIAKQAPRVLMPLYHQAIDAAIQTRNRQGYKIAVKQLKKLERLYKSEKDTASWEHYIAGIIHKYQRLRAFQEELWKGKIST